MHLFVHVSLILQGVYNDCGFLQYDSLYSDECSTFCHEQSHSRLLKTRQCHIPEHYVAIISSFVGTFIFFQIYFCLQNRFVLSCCCTYLEKSGGGPGVLYLQRTIILLATKEIHIIYNTYIVVLYKVCLNHHLFIFHLSVYRYNLRMWK